jgi:hypothetical protein
VNNTPRTKYSKHGLAVRNSRRERLGRFLSGKVASLTSTATPLTASAVVANGFTIAAHGLSYAQGPFVVTGTTLPTGIVAGRLYWAVPLDANTVQLTTENPLNGLTGTIVTIAAGTGTGTIALVRAVTFNALFNLLQRFGPKVVRAAVDIDNLK